MLNDTLFDPTCTEKKWSGRYLKKEKILSENFHQFNFLSFCYTSNLTLLSSHSKICYAYCNKKKKNRKRDDKNLHLSATLTVLGFGWNPGIFTLLDYSNSPQSMTILYLHFIRIFHNRTYFSKFPIINWKPRIGLKIFELK